MERATTATTRTTARVTKAMKECIVTAVSVHFEAKEGEAQGGRG